MANSKARPYSVGFNGHAKSCDCKTCGESRRQVFAAQLKTVLQASRAAPTVVKLPTSADQTVFVRAHYKRSPNHLRKYPLAKRLFRAVLERVVA